MLPAAIYEEKEDIYKEFKEFSESGANFLIAPTYLYASPNDKIMAMSETQNAAQNGAFICNGIVPVPDGITLLGGGLSYDEYYEEIKKEASFLYKNIPGAVIFLMGFKTLLEAKCAVYAVKEVCDLPICVLMDFDDDMVLHDGFDAASTVITLQSLNISAVGVVADDPDLVLDILWDMKEFSSVPLFAFPRCSEFITPIEYAEYAHDYVNSKCVMFGGGEGTDVRHIAQIAKVLWQLEPFMPDFPTVNAVCGASGISFLDFHNRSIGKNTKLIEMDLDKISKIQEVDLVIEKLIAAGLPPVCFKCKDIEILERAIKLYPGRAGVKSDEYGEITAKEYGALVLDNKEER